VGIHRCCRVRVCQSPVLTRALAGGALYLLSRCCCRRWLRVKVMHERVAGIDVHKDMVKVAIRSPGEKRWARKTEVLTFGTFYGVLREMARGLRRRGVTHVAMEASGVYTEPVYYALMEEDFDEVLVVNPAHVKAIKGQKTDAKDCARIAELLECGLLQGSYLPPPELKEMRDLTRYRIKKVQARTSEIQRLGKTLESAGIKLGSVASDITGTGPLEMIESLVNGERDGAVMAGLARGRARTPQKMASLSMALEGRFTRHHAAMCRLIIDQVNALKAGDYFKLLAKLMKDNPPAKEDAAMVAKLKKVGIEPGQDFDISKLDPAVARGLEKATKP